MPLHITDSGRSAGEVRRELANDRLPPVQPFHAMAYPFSAELALKISAKYADFCAVTASRMGVPKLPHPPAQPLKVPPPHCSAYPGLVI